MVHADGVPVESIVQEGIQTPDSRRDVQWRRHGGGRHLTQAGIKFITSTSAGTSRSVCIRYMPRPDISSATPAITSNATSRRSAAVFSTPLTSTTARWWPTDSLCRPAIISRHGSASAATSQGWIWSTTWRPAWMTPHGVSYAIIAPIFLH